MPRASLGKLSVQWLTLLLLIWAAACDSAGRTPGVADAAGDSTVLDDGDAAQTSAGDTGGQLGDAGRRGGLVDATADAEVEGTPDERLPDIVDISWSVPDELDWPDPQTLDSWGGSPGCSEQYYATPKGCKSCGEIAVQLPLAISEAFDNANLCTADSECTEFSMPQAICGYTCPIVLAKNAIAVATVWAQLAGQWCPQVPTVYKIDCTYPCKQGTPQCVAGRCRKVGVCDPLVAGPGTACDDGKLCTLQDACAGPGVCTGQAADCGDGNPCTADSCDPLKGCVNTPTAAQCSSGVSCSIAASCQGGKCVDSGLKGWAKQVHGPDSISTSAFAAMPGGGYAIALRGSADTLIVKRVNEVGEVLWQTNSGPALATVGSVVALDGGEIAVAGTNFDKPGSGSAAYLLRLTGDGKVLGWSALPLGSMSGLRMTSVAAGLMVAGGKSNGDNTWNAWVALLNVSGKLQWQADLGPVANDGLGTTVAAGAAGYGVLTSAPGAKTALGEQADLHFVHLSAQGAKLSEASWPSSDYDYPNGIASLSQGGWLLAGTAMVVNKGGAKTAVGVLRIVNASGQTTATTTNPISYPLGFVGQASALSLISASAGSKGLATLVQPIGGSGEVGAGWQIPPWPAGENPQLPLLQGDGSAVFLLQNSAAKSLTLHRIWPPCLGPSCPTVSCGL